MKVQRAVLGAAMMMLALGVGDLRAQRLGAQLNWGSDADLGVGLRLEANANNVLTNSGALSRTYFIGSFDVYFPDAAGDLSWWELNANLAVPVTATTVDPYLGLGLNLAHVSIDAGPFGDHSDTDLGLNVLGGLRFPIGNLRSFAELRGTIGGGDQLNLTFGIMFGRR